MLSTFLIFLVFLCPLIFFHELGHFLAARMFGVRVEVFALGFGKRIFTYRRKETDYVIALIPLGGYVKMYGDDPFNKNQIDVEQRKFSYSFKENWKKAIIVFAGPLANFIFAFVLYAFLQLKGEKVSPFVLGIIPESSILSTDLGLRTRDEILEINERVIKGVEDFGLIGNEIKSILIKRNSIDNKIDVKNYDTLEFIRNISILQPILKPLFISENKNSYLLINIKDNFPRNFEEIYENWKNFETDYVFQEYNLGKVDNKIRLEDNLKDLGDKQKISKELFYEALNKQGYYLAELVVKEVRKGSVAEKIKLISDDVILEINNKTVTSFFKMRDLLQASNGEKIHLKIKRNKETLDFSLLPDVQIIGKTKNFTMGIITHIETVDSEMRVVKSDSVFGAITDAFLRTINNMKSTVSGIFALFSRKDALEMIGGPISIAKAASDSFSLSIDQFLRLMSIISINLGIINLFPVPVLDGGHLVLIFIESVTRRTMPIKFLEWLYRFGFVVILSLVFLALFNDISRFWK